MLQRGHRGSVVACADVLVVGGGCIGLSAGSAIARRRIAGSVLLLEQEPSCGLHASTRNSSVLHAGFYYSQDSFKARLTRKGNEMLSEFIRSRGLPLNECGKLVVASTEAEVDTLELLYERGSANGVPLEILSYPEALAIEPNLSSGTIAALWSPTTSTSDCKLVNKAQVAEAERCGVKIVTGAEVSDISEDGRGVRVTTRDGRSYECAHLVNTAGLYADKIAHLCNVARDYAMVPFRGLYVQLDPGVVQLRTNIYPTPSLSVPFLGTHLTLSSNGSVKIGPTALPALWRRQYHPFTTENFSATEAFDIARLLARMIYLDPDNLRSHILNEIPKYSVGGMCRSASGLVNASSSVGEWRSRSRWSRGGIRAQLVHRPTAALQHDFMLENGQASTHVLNAVSPAWTCALPVAELVADRVQQQLQHHHHHHSTTRATD